MLKYQRFKPSGCNLSVTKTQFRLENIPQAPDLIFHRPQDLIFHRPQDLIFHKPQI